jgi:glucose/arabinose dehydrogenase
MYCGIEADASEQDQQGRMMKVALIRRRFSAVVLLAVFASAPGAPHAATSLPEGFQEELVISGRTNPTAVRFAPNGQVFVAEKSGLVWAYDGVGDATPTLVIDLRAKVHNFWDRGLLGLAVAPGYPATPHLYVLYAHDVWPDGTGPRWDTAVPGPSTGDPCPTPPGATADGCVVFGRLSRIVIDTQTMQGSELPLIGAGSALADTRWAWCQQYPSHSVGDLYFGEDGYLYASAGDGASFNFADWGQDGDPLNPCDDPPAGDGNLDNGSGTTNTGAGAAGGALRSQDIVTPLDPTSFDGAILRIDVSANPVQAPADNPLVSNGVPGDDFIIAIGLRNPFRITGRPGTPEIWVADVGWNTWEEINRIATSAAPVENFGWPCYEGGSAGSVVQTGYDQQTLCQAVYDSPPEGIVTTAPYWAYRHADQVVAGELCGTGGSSVTGIAFNSGTAYPAAYGGALFFADSTRKCIWTMFAGAGGTPDRNNRLALASQTAGRIVDLQMGPDGRLYYVDFDNGRIYRINYFGVNVPPVAVAAADVSSGPAPLTVTLDGSGSSDPEDGTALEYAWDLDGDGEFDDAFGASVVWIFEHVGVHVATLRVEDSQGAVGSDAVTITAGNTPPLPVILSPLASEQWAVGDVLSLSGEAMDEQDGTLPGDRLSWDILMHHCYTLDNCHTHPLTTVEGSATAEFVAEDHEYPSYLEIRLTARDLPPPDWFDPAWERRRRLTVDNSGQGQAFTNLPLLVVIDPTRIDYGAAAPDGRDLRFTDAAGNLLPHEIESWVPYGTSHVWVGSPLVPAGSGATALYMYYGNAGAAADAEDAAALWSEYRAVWHLHEDAADATANANHGTVVQATDAGGIIGLAKHFDGANARIDVPDSASLRITGPLTIEAWIGIDDPNQAGAPRVVSKKPAWDAAQGYNLEYKPGDNNVTSLGSGSDYLRADGIDLDTSWHYLVAVHNGDGAGTIYVDGVNRGSDNTASLLAAGSTLLRIGAAADDTASSKFLGAIDELRLAAVARSAAWQRASYLSMTDQLLSFGAEEQVVTLASSTSVLVHPRTLDITLASSPPGLQVTMGSETRTAPFTTTVIENSAQSVEAPAPQALAGAYYAFDGWSDGGDQQHMVTVAGSDLTLTAQFVPFENLAPSIAISSPENGASYAAPGVVPIVTSAADPDDGLARVDFFVDGGLVGTRTAPPWQADWDAESGVHVLTAVAVDSLGAATTSAPVAVSVAVEAGHDGDGDQLPDLWEAQHGLDWQDPADAASDGDGDGLSALQEFQNGTDPGATDTDGDGASDGAELRFGSIPADPASLPPDSDGDGLRDHLDNCTAAANGPAAPDAGGHSQLDTDGDGYGNACDADLNQDGFVNFTDLALFRSAFGTTNADADLNGSGFVNFADLALFRAGFGQPPGPSGLH